MGRPNVCPICAAPKLPEDKTCGKESCKRRYVDRTGGNLDGAA